LLSQTDTKTIEKTDVYSCFADDCSNNILEFFNKTFKAWYKTKKGFHSFDSAMDMISNFLFYYNFIHSHSSLSDQSPASVAGVTYSQEQANHWFLF
jgi:transposase InsO family protein